METIKTGISSFEHVPPGAYTSCTDTLTILNLFAEPLVRSIDGKLWPALAQSWQVFDEGRRWLFSLRPKAMFHDNTPCSIVDVLDCIEMAAQRIDEYGMPSPLPRYLQKVKFNIIDRQTFEAVSDEPNGDIADFLSEILIRKSGRTGEYIVGTGQYEFVDYVPKRILRLKKNDESKRFSSYKEINFRVIPDPEERLEALRSGKINYAANLQEIIPIKETPDLRWFHTVNNLSIIGFLNGREKPFNNPIARKAINLAIDVDGLIQKIFHGAAIPAATVVSPYHCGFESSIKPIPYDPQEAKRLFALTDMPDELLVRVPAKKPTEGPQIGAYIVDQLKEIGVNARLDVQPNRQQYAFELGRNQMGHVALFNSSPFSTFRILSDKISSSEKGMWWQGIEDLTTDALVTEANREKDMTTRERKYAAALKHLNENPPWLFLYHPLSISAAQHEVNNIELLHTGSLRFPGVW